MIGIEGITVHVKDATISIIADRASIVIGVGSLVAAVAAIVFTLSEGRKSQEFFKNQKQEMEEFLDSQQKRNEQIFLHGLQLEETRSAIRSRESQKLALFLQMNNLEKWKTYKQLIQDVDEEILKAYEFKNNALDEMNEKLYPNSYPKD